MKKSKFLTAVGIIAAAAQAFQQSGNSVLETIGSIVLPIALLLMGYGARGDETSSEEAGIK